MLRLLGRLEYIRRGYERRLARRSARSGGSLLMLGGALVVASVVFPPAALLAAPAGLVLVDLGILGILTAVLSPVGELLY